jgi:hypothetical protein
MPDLTYTEITKSKCGTCGRPVAIVRAEVPGDRDVKPELKVARHLRSAGGFCGGSFTHVEPLARSGR